jgi:hypothetical protein
VISFLKQRERNEWNFTAGKLMAAAESGTRADIKAATDALESALFLDGFRLKLN